MSIEGFAGSCSPPLLGARARARRDERLAVCRQLLQAWWEVARPLREAVFASTFRDVVAEARHRRVRVCVCSSVCVWARAHHLSPPWPRLPARATRRRRRRRAGGYGPRSRDRGTARRSPVRPPPSPRRNGITLLRACPLLAPTPTSPTRPPPLLRISLSFPPPQPSNHQRQRAPLPPKDGPAWPLAFSDARTCSRQSLGTPLVVLTARLARRSRARRRRVDSLTRKKGGRLSSPPPPRARSPSKYPGARGGRVCAQSVNARHRPAHSSRSPRPRPGGARARARASRAPPRK